MLNNATETRKHDGNDVVGDYTNSTSNPKLKRTYANGLSVDQKIGRFKANGDKSWHLRDRLNSTTAVIGNDGAVQNHYTSNAWGSSLHRFESNPQRYTFTGREEDRESGFMHFRARSYFPTIGRFMQRDSVGPYSRNYKYGRNNPVRYSDPMGKFEKDIHFYMTYFLARKNGFPQEESLILAGATQYTDEDPLTNPTDEIAGMDIYPATAKVLRTFHFPQRKIQSASGQAVRTGKAKRLHKQEARYEAVKRNSEVANEFVKQAIKQARKQSLSNVAPVQGGSSGFWNSMGELRRAKTLLLAGIGFHRLQDSFSHEGYKITSGGILSREGHGLENVAANLPGLTKPDNPHASAVHRSTALDMAVKINNRLRTLSKEMGFGGTQYTNQELREQFGELFSKNQYPVGTRTMMMPSDSGGVSLVGTPQTVKDYRDTDYLRVRVKMWKDFIRRDLGAGSVPDLSDFSGHYQGLFREQARELMDNE